MSPTDDDTEELEALLEKAETALDAGDVDKALELLDESAHDPEAHPDVRAMYGLALYYGGEYEEAFDYLVEAVDHDPDDAECRGALGVCYFYRLDPDRERLGRGALLARSRARVPRPLSRGDGRVPEGADARWRPLPGAAPHSR